MFESWSQLSEKSCLGWSSGYDSERLGDSRNTCHGRRPCWHPPSWWGRGNGWIQGVVERGRGRGRPPPKRGTAQHFRDGQNYSLGGADFSGAPPRKNACPRRWLGNEGATHTPRAWHREFAKHTWSTHGEYGIGKGASAPVGSGCVGQLGAVTGCITILV